MKSHPNANYVSNDDVQTPPELALGIMRHFKPSGIFFEPCKGDGAFIKALGRWQASATKEGESSPVQRTEWSEIKEGRDFLNPHYYVIKADWLITNPPWSKVREFLQRSMQIADNIVFLMTVNHCWTKARVRDVKEAGFGLKEILLCDMPKEFPQSGFQLGAMHWQRGWKGDIKLSSLETPSKIHV